MTTYTYTLSYRSRTGSFVRVGFNSEARMFDCAAEIDRNGGELLDAVREVWEVREGRAHFLRVEHYRNGKPQAA